MAIENPFQDPLRFERQAPECAIVIFGANGDLTKRKLMPALYRLAYDRRLSAGFAVIGISRTPLSDDQFRDKMLEAVKQFSEDTAVDADVWAAFARGLYYVAGDIGDAALYQRLGQKLAAVESERHTGGNALFYLSTQPSQYAQAALGLGAAGLGKGGGWRRLVVEKPFGHDLASARELSGQLHEVFNESDVYRIDHYLGKETVQNILAFRFGNGIFEPLWNRRYVNHVQITGAESIGVEGRGAYYQEAGALADMIQNHLLQVMATIAMEPVASFRAISVRDEKSKLLRSMRAMTPDEVRRNSVAGQYGPARIGGQDDRGVPAGAGGGRAIADGHVRGGHVLRGELAVGGRAVLRADGQTAAQARHRDRHPIQPGAARTSSMRTAAESAPNLLIVRIQPEEGISLKFLSKRPGAGMTLRPVSMDFNYGSSFGERSPSAYETLLLDAIIGDATLYTRQDMVEASWSVVEPIQNVWRETKFDFPNYAAGTWGPAAADEMLARRGHAWRKP